MADDGFTTVLRKTKASIERGHFQEDGDHPFSNPQTTEIRHVVGSCSVNGGTITIRAGNDLQTAILDMPLQIGKAREFINGTQVLCDLSRAQLNEKWKATNAVSVPRLLEISENHWGPKPNFFVSLPIRNEALVTRLTSLRGQVLDLPNVEAEVVKDPRNWHVTVCLLFIDNLKDLKKAQDYVKGIQNQLLQGDQKLISFRGLGQFDRATYVSLGQESHGFFEGEMLKVEKGFWRLGIKVYRKRKPVPHMTLVDAKIGDVAPFDREFGTQPYDTVQLCSMNLKRRDLTYWSLD